MGEIADMMIDGFLDYETGEVLDGDAPGFPRTQAGYHGKPHQCKVCGKRFRTAAGRSQHIRDKKHQTLQENTDV